MSVCVTVPSARPPDQVNAWAAKWRAMGYRVAIQRDIGQLESLQVDRQVIRPYAGYAEAVNHLARWVFADDYSCDWIVIGGDDVFPDPTKRADQIARECQGHFAGTFGVMQPTGDRWGADEAWAKAQFPDRPAYIDRVAGSAWIGREFCQRAYGGNGPLWPEYTHMFCDEELQEVAEKMEVFWQRPDLTQYHNHWGREGFQNAAPDFLREANSGGHWAKYESLFKARKAAGFLGSDLKHKIEVTLRDAGRGTPAFLEND